MSVKLIVFLKLRNNENVFYFFKNGILNYIFAKGMFKNIYKMENCFITIQYIKMLDNMRLEIFFSFTLLKIKCLSIIIINYWPKM